MTRYRVTIAEDAEKDLREIVGHVAEFDSVQHAEALLERLLRVCDSLVTHPSRGRYVPELRAVGLRAFREILCKPYRIIYEIAGRRVQVLVIADGRRRFNALLQRRLVR